MSSKEVTILTPPREDVQRFCSEHSAPPSALLELSWALVLHCYFDVCTFLLDETCEDVKGDDDAPVIVNFLPELADKTPAVVALQRNGKQQLQDNTVLHHCNANEFGSSSQKIWSRLQISRNSFYTHNNRIDKIHDRRKVCLYEAYDNPS